MRILVLTSSTGGGHDMRAQALKAWAESAAAAHLNIEVSVFQVLESTSRFYRFGVDLYNGIQRTWPRLHHAYFNFLEAANLLRSPHSIRNAQRFQWMVEQYAPDIVLSTHPHLNHGFFELARSVALPRSPLCVTYCGELFGGYGFSKHWVNPEADLFIGAVDETTRAAITLGMPPDKAITGGFLLKPKFYRPPMTAEDRERFLRVDHRLDPARFTLVLATGANGANNHLDFLDALEGAGLRPQVVALCGRQIGPLENVLHWASERPNWRVRALRYYDRVFELLQSADAVIARPGTGTTSEAIMARCPIIFNVVGGAMPQEMITIKYFLKYNWPKPVGRPTSLPGRIRRWIEDEREYRKAHELMGNKRPQGHPLHILEHLCQLAFERHASSVA